MSQDDHLTDTSTPKTQDHVPVRYGTTLLTDDDLFLFNEGSHFQLYEKLGAQLLNRDGGAGTQFAVWAPNARQVSVIGDFNGWDRQSHPLQPIAAVRYLGGVRPGCRPGGALQVLHRVPPQRLPGRQDRPIRRFFELAPKTASIVWDLDYEWGDQAWMAARRKSATRPRAHVHLRGAPGLLAPGARRRRTARSPTGRWPPCWPNTCGAWGSPTWSSCR